MSTLRPFRSGGRGFARGLTLSTASLSVGALVVFGAVAPASATTGDPSEASSQFVTASGLDLSAAELAGSYAATPGGPAAQSTTFDAAAYDALIDQVSLVNSGLAHDVPLVFDPSAPAGLLAVNQADIVGYSSSVNVLSAVSANGAVDANTGAFTEASAGGSTVNLGAAFDALGVSSLTREVLSQIDLEVGSVASRAVADAYGGASGDYRLEGLSLELTSPLLQQLPSVIDTTLQGATVLAKEALEVLAPGGVVDLPAGTIPDIAVNNVGTLKLGDIALTVTAPNFDNVVSDVMNTPGGVVVVSDDGIATVNLNTGEIAIDLAQLLGGSANGLAANTEVFTSANMTAISAAVANALSKTTPLFAGGVVSALHATQLGMGVDVEVVAATSTLTPNLNGLTVASGTLSGSGSLDDFANGTSAFSSSLAQAPGLPSCAGPLFFGNCPTPTSSIVSGAIAVINLAVPTLAPTAIAAIASPLMDALTDAEDRVIAEVDTVVADAYQRITSAFDGLMPSLATVVVNQQPTVGDLGADSFTVRALGVTMLPTLPGSNQAHIGLASSTVLAVANPSVNAVEVEVKAGSSVTIQGAGWDPAGGQVTLAFVDASSSPVGAPLVATPAADGSIATTWTVPGGTPSGVLTLIATQGEVVRSDSVKVMPVIAPVAPKTALPTTGSDSAPLWFGGVGLVLLAAGGTLFVARSRRS